MTNCESAILIAVFVTAFLCLSFNGFEGFSDTVLTQAQSDKREYPVLDRVDKQQAANMIAELNQFAESFIQKLRDKFESIAEDQHSNPLFKKGKRITDYLLRRYSTSSLSENQPIDKRFTSYTYNKGKMISLCLREQSSGKFTFHDMHTLKFVFLHELAHVASEQFANDHGVQFMSDFKFLLHHAQEFGLYQPVNYQNRNTDYCSVRITYSPLFDGKIDMLR